MAGVGLVIEGDPELVDIVRLVMPRLFWGEGEAQGRPVWRIRLERVLGPTASLDAPVCQEEIRTETGRVVLSKERVCRICTRDEFGLGVLIHLAIAAILRRNRILQIHAAALCPPDSASAFLFVGPSGAGKTTLTMNLARRSWGFLSDDSVVLTDSEGEFLAMPLRPSFRIVREGHARKELFDPEQEFPGQRLASVAIKGLVFVEQSGAKGSLLTPLSREDAFARLPAATPEFGSGEDARWQLGFIARLSALPSFILAAGRDVLSDDDALDRLLRNLRTEVRAA